MTAAYRPDEPHDEAAHDAEFQRTLERLVTTPPKPHYAPKGADAAKAGGGKAKKGREPKPAPKSTGG